MNFIITLIILVLILGFIVFFHELGHFLMAKKANVYVYEFSIGMGPKLWQFKRKNDETVYSLRLLPLGGFVGMADEENKEDKISKNRVLSNKKFYQKILVLVMGIIFNFILALIIFFMNGLIYGSPITKPYLGDVLVDSPAYTSGLREGDLVTSVNGKNVISWDDVILEITVKESDEYVLEIEKEDGSKYEKTIIPTVTEDEDGNKVKVFGISKTTKRNFGFINALKYSFNATGTITKSIFNILGSLFTGKVGLNSLSGPVGIFKVVDNVKSAGFETILYLVAYLSINVGVINLMPVTVFDGGRLLLVIIEKILNKKLSYKVEAYLNYIGFCFLILLMIYVTFNDILKLF